MIKNYVAFDLETTGLSAENDYIIEIGALKVIEGKVCGRFMTFVKPPITISPMITNITGITDEMVASAEDTEKIIRDFVAFCENYTLIGHNIMFDYKFMKKYTDMYHLQFEHTGIDTLHIARKVHKSLESKSLGTLCEYYNIQNQAAHRAYHDALATAKLYQTLAHHFENEEPQLFQSVQLGFQPVKMQPCTKKQQEYLSLLCEYHNMQLPDNYTQLTRSEASRLIDSIIATKGRMI